MDIAAVKESLRGPMIPVITNLRDDLSIDHEAIKENVRFVIDAGVQTGSGALLAVGAGGDFPVLTVEERKAACATIFEAANGQAPVIFGAQDTNPAVSVEIAQYAEELGAWGIQMSPTFYYASSDGDCLRLFQKVHDATSSINMMIYNTYWEAYNINRDTLVQLADLPRCTALKWSCQNATAYLKTLHEFSDRFAIIDNQGLQVMNRMMGGTGYITHLATLWPEHDLKVWSLLESGEYQQAQQLISDINWPFQEFRGIMWNRTGSESPVIKTGLELCGRPGGPNRPPVRSCNEEEREDMRQRLERIGVPAVASA